MPKVTALWMTTARLRGGCISSAALGPGAPLPRSQKRGGRVPARRVKSTDIREQLTECAGGGERERCEATAVAEPARHSQKSLKLNSLARPG